MKCIIRLFIWELWFFSVIINSYAFFFQNQFSYISDVLVDCLSFSFDSTNFISSCYNFQWHTLHTKIQFPSICEFPRALLLLASGLIPWVSDRYKESFWYLYVSIKACFMIYHDFGKVWWATGNNVHSSFVGCLILYVDIKSNWFMIWLCH